MNNYIISYTLTILAFIITLCAQFFVNSSYKKYSKIKNLKNISGMEVARSILDKNGLNDIYIVETKGHLTDHYDPSRKVIRLSTEIYHNSSISSVAVAAHECGHAIQDKEKYTFLKVRSMLVPFVNFSSYAGYIAIVLGIVLSSMNLIWLGILAEIVILLFQLVTLPVELNASKRALKELSEMELLSTEELPKGKKVLTAAAMTYVASVASTVLELLRLILIYGNRSRD